MTEYMCNFACKYCSYFHSVFLPVTHHSGNNSVYSKTRRKSLITRCSLSSNSLEPKLTVSSNHFSALIYLVTIIFFICLPSTEACYAYPPGKRNPCIDMNCHDIGAICVVTKDGLESRCVCQQECFDYGDSLGSKPVCGSDDKDYPNQCEMRRAACRNMSKIYVKHYGKCGEFYFPGVM